MKFLGPILSILASIMKIFERRQLINLGRQKHRNEQLEAEKKKIKAANDARNDVPIDADSLRDDPNNRSD